MLGRVSGLDPVTFFSVTVLLVGGRWLRSTCRPDARCGSIRWSRSAPSSGSVGFARPGPSFEQRGRSGCSFVRARMRKTAGRSHFDEPVQRQLGNLGRDRVAAFEQLEGDIIALTAKPWHEDVAGHTR